MWSGVVDATASDGSTGADDIDGAGAGAGAGDYACDGWFVLSGFVWSGVVDATASDDSTGADDIDGTDVRRLHSDGLSAEERRRHRYEVSITLKLRADP